MKAAGEVANNAEVFATVVAGQHQCRRSRGLTVAAWGRDGHSGVCATTVVDLLLGQRPADVSLHSARRVRLLHRRDVA